LAITESPGSRFSGFDLRVGDAFRLIEALDDQSVQLTVTSPPYNIGKVYEKRAQLSEYLVEFESFSRSLYRKTTAGGSVCWQIGNYVEKGEVYPLDIFFYAIFKDAGFKLRNRIVWHFDHGLHANRRLSGRYETILWFTKGEDYLFQLDPIRVASKYPGKRHFKGEKRGLPSGNPAGKNPSDYWPRVVLEDWETLVWDIPNVKANHLEKTIHPCQFPVELVQRCVLALSRPGDLILDPFAGVGSAAVGALLHGRHFVGFERDEEYAKVATERVRQLQDGTLRVRRLGKPVYAPTGREGVARLPQEWLEHPSDAAEAEAATETPIAGAPNS